MATSSLLQPLYLALFCWFLTYYIYLEGLWKENKDDDPFHNVKGEFTDMIDQKQTQEEIAPKMINLKEVGKEDVNMKNIIKKVPTTNRGPKDKSPSPEPTN